MSENWLKVSIYTTPEGVEALCGALLSVGIEGTEICDESDFLNFLDTNRSKWDYVDDEKRKHRHMSTFFCARKIRKRSRASKNVLLR